EAFFSYICFANAFKAITQNKPKGQKKGKPTAYQPTLPLCTLLTKKKGGKMTKVQKKDTV
ncbi:MAG: hypothetical protein WC951_11705, partial [Bacteroidales bacterium]